MIWRDGTSEKDKIGLGENFLPQRKRFRHDIEVVTTEITCFDC
jgi:hypothetical protein